MTVRGDSEGKRIFIHFKREAEHFRKTNMPSKQCYFYCCVI